VLLLWLLLCGGVVSLCGAFLLVIIVLPFMVVLVDDKETMRHCFRALEYIRGVTAKPEET
jgi:hypothetical protein